MARLFMTIGIPGTGKSTWIKRFLGKHIDIVSSDAIREGLGDVNDQSRNEEVFRIFHELIDSSLRNGYDCVADSTALDIFARQKLYDIARRANAEVHIIFFRNVHQAYERNLSRERVVPEEAMVRMLDKYERTLLNLPFEADQYTTLTEIQNLS